MHRHDRPESEHYSLIPYQALLYSRKVEGIRLYTSMSAAMIPYDHVNGWPIRYPDIDRPIDKNTVIVIHMQDFMTIRPDRSCAEIEAIEKHYGADAKQVVLLHWHYRLEQYYNGPIKLVYFPNHSTELYSNLFWNENKWAHNFNYRQRLHPFQCLNGLPRSHRQKVVAELERLGVIDTGIVSNDTQRLLPRYSYDTYSGCENETNWMRLQYVYANCAVNVVTETMYEEPSGIISEKTLFAFLAKQIPIVIGYPGIVDHLEQLGFDMFRDIVDTRYDFQHNNVRWKNALRSNLALLQTPITTKMYDDIKHRLDANFELLRGYETRWNTHLYNELIDFARSIQR